MKLLLIMPKFFEYPRIISEELERMGYEVDFFDDRPSTNAWIKAAIRINKNLISRVIDKYFTFVMETVSSKKYDAVLLISGQSLSFSEDMVEKIRKCQPQADFVLYQWDSQANFPYIKKVQKYFDRMFSFDREDCRETEGLSFLPLFYSADYEKIGSERRKGYKYDFCFVGTAHPKKYKFIGMMSEQLKNVFPRQFIYFFFPSPIVYFYRKLKNREFRNARYKEFHYVPLNTGEMMEIYRDSRCVLDSAQDGQIGLTIRVLEALGARKKLITTNSDIVNYDFYKPENIYVYDGQIDLDNVFFKKEYEDPDADIYRKYSLRMWLKTLLNAEEQN